MTLSKCYINKAGGNTDQLEKLVDEISENLQNHSEIDPESLLGKVKSACD